MRPSQRLFTVGVALAVTSACAAGAEGEDEAPMTLTAAPGLVPVNGNWATVDDSGPALRVDGAEWSGQADTAAVRSALTSLYGTADSTFVAATVGDGSFPLAVWSDTATFSSGTVRVRFRMEGGASDQNAGIVFGLRPTGEYTYVRYNTKDGDVAVWEFVNGARRLLTHGTTHEQLPLGEWHELVVTVEGATVTGTVTGRNVSVEHTLAAPPVGRVGLWTKRDAVTAFRDFRVERAP